MWPELNRLAKGSAVYGIGSVLQRFLSLLLLPFFTRVLSTQEYGVVALVALVAMALSGLFSLGTGSSMNIIYFECDTRTERHRVVWSTAALLTVNCIVLLAVLVTASPYISHVVFETTEYANLLRIAFTSTMIVVVLEPFYAFLRLEGKAARFVTLSVVGAVAGALISIVLVLVLGWGIRGLLLASLFAQILSAILVAVTVARHLTFGITTRFFVPLVRIGFPSIFGVFAFFVIDYLDRQMLQRMIGLDAVGIYSVGYNLGLVMLVAVSAFGMAWPPFFTSFIKRQEEAKVLFGKILNYYLIIFGGLAALFFVAAKPLVTLLAPDFATAGQIIGIVAVAYMLKGAYLIILPGIYFAKKLHWQAVVEWAAAIANIGLNLLLIPVFGIVGAAVATLASYALMTVLAWMVARHYLAVEYHWRQVAVAVGGIGVTCTWVFWASMQLSFTGLAIHSLLALSMLFIVFGFYVLDRSERSVLTAQAIHLVQRQ